MSSVVFENVSLAYTPGGENAIEDVTLAIREGEFVAVVGPSGCGKSTLMKLVTGLKPPSKGYVYVDDREVGGPLKIVGMAFFFVQPAALAHDAGQRDAAAGNR